MTLVELTVVMMMLSLVGMMTMRVMTSLTRSTGRATSAVLTERDGSAVLRAVTEDLRAANPIASTYPSTSTCPSGGSYPSGYSSCVSFTIVRAALSTASCPKTVVTYGLVSGVLKENRTEYGSTCAVRATTTGHVLLTGLLNTSTSPLFTFYDRAGATLTASSGTSAYVTAASVKVTLAMSSVERGSATPTVTGYAALRNTR
jgi:type II secretory pathway pseudopilin PulG